MKKILFTNDDIQSFKSALSSYSAKEKALIEKCSRYRSYCEKCIASSSDESSRFSFISMSNLLEQVLIDLRTPADIFLTDFEMKGCK